MLHAERRTKPARARKPASLPAEARTDATIEAMEAKSVSSIPRGKEWQYEPKWDGFRCLLSRHGEQIELTSKSGQSLTRYFPELVTAALALKEKSFLLDGEIVVPDGDALSFDRLLQRIHPAASRVKRLAQETPALFIAFDLLRTAKKSGLASQPMSVRRPALEDFAAKAFREQGTFRLSPITLDVATAKAWLAKAGGGFDGVIAKRRDLPYQAGNRDGMQKIKNFRSADCVVGGFRYATNRIAAKRVVGSLLLGLYDGAGLFHHVGFTSAISNADKPALTEKLKPLIVEVSFTGNTPGGPSRWSTARSAQWCPLKPKLVVEVCYDHISGQRFRHGTTILRWRPDKRPKQCTFEQLRQKSVDPLALLD